MRYGQFLKEGGVIGFVAPSFGCATEPYKSAFNNALKKFKEEGYAVDIGPNCYSDKGIGISNTPEECGKELTEYYVNKANDVLISCGGGELMCQTMDYVDFQKIKEADPKWYLGYSDNTNFTFLSTTICDTAAIYGPCASSFGMEERHRSLEDCLKLLKGEKLEFDGYDMWEKESLKSEENPLASYNLTEKSLIRSFPEGELNMKGRLIGGCLDCLANIVGTKYDKAKEFAEKYKEDGILWFMEACELTPLAVRRALWQLDRAGWFENCSGFVFGRPMLYGQEIMGLDHYEAVKGIVEKYNVPILMDADIGHLPPAVSIISGSMADIEVKGGKYRIKMHLK